MKRKINRLLPLLYGTVIFSLLPVAAATNAWPLPEASYRMELNHTLPQVAGFIDLSRYVLPDPLGNGIDLRDEQGRPVDFYWDAEHCRLITGKNNPPRLMVYFGFSRPQPEARRQGKPDGNIPALECLTFSLVRARINYLTEQDWFNDQADRAQKHFDRRLINLCGNMTRFMLARDLAAARYDLVDVRQELLIRAGRRRLQQLASPHDFLSDVRRRKGLDRLRRLEHDRRRNSSYRSQFNNRMKTQLKHLSLLPSQRERKLDELRGKMPGCLARNLVETYDRVRKRHLIGQKEWRDTVIPLHPFEQRNFIAALLAGSLIVPADGDYTLAVNSSSSALLYLDGQLCLDWYGPHPPTPDWTRKVTLHLKKGLHPFKFYYHKNQETTMAAVAWKRPGDADFRILQRRDFAPGWPLQPVRVVARQGGEFPLVKRLEPSWLYLDKDRKLTWERAAVIAPVTMKTPVWQLNGRTIRTGNNIDLFSDRHAPAESVVLRDPAGKLLPLPITFLPDHRNLEELIVEADLRLQLWLPHFLYDDEEPTVSWEIRSQMPHALVAVLTLKTNRNQMAFPDREENIPLPAWTYLDEKNFRPAQTVKGQLDLAALNSVVGLEMDFRLAVTALEFDHFRVRLVPLAQCPPLQLDGMGFHDRDGNLIIPVLHRPDLDELREWELPRELEENLQPRKQLLLVGDDFGRDDRSWSHTLSRRLAARDIRLEFASWHRSDGDRDNPLASLSPLLRQLKETAADTVIIIPPVNYRDLPPRDR
ncbi:MAG: PA14 domain-containing protein, partial [Victivallales bacterium]|nr:PA14 domain-containing protein [Victivallales bacterium]